MYKLPPSTLKAFEWEKSHKYTARSCYINKKMTAHGNSYNVVTIGVHVCVNKPWLAALPDSLVEDPSEPPERHHALLVIKCPYSARMLKPSAACTELNMFCCDLVSEKPALKKKHDYHYHIQEVLYITEKL